MNSNKSIKTSKTRRKSLEERLYMANGTVTAVSNKNRLKTEAPFDERLRAAEEGLCCDTACYINMLEEFAENPLKELLAEDQYAYILKYAPIEDRERPGTMPPRLAGGDSPTYRDAADYLNTVWHIRAVEKGTRSPAFYEQTDFANRLLDHLWDRFSLEANRRLDPDEFSRLGYKDPYTSYPIFRILTPTYFQAASSRCVDPEIKKQLAGAYRRIFKPFFKRRQNVIQYYYSSQPVNNTGYTDISTASSVMWNEIDDNLMYSPNEKANYLFNLLVWPYISENRGKCESLSK